MLVTTLGKRKSGTGATFVKLSLTVHNLASYITVTCILYYIISKVRLQKIPKYLYELLSIDNTTPRILLPLLNSSDCQKNFLVYGSKIWNLILPFIKDKNYDMPTSFYQHKSRFKKFLIKMQSYGSDTEWSDVNFDVENIW